MEDWSEAELEAAVEGYVEILNAEQAGASASKSDIRDRLMAGPLAARTRGSIEYRMQNISAVLDSMGKAWVAGYKPAANVGPTNERRLRELLTARLDLPLPDAVTPLTGRISPNRVYVANFGRENFDWPTCLQRACVSTMQDERAHEYWARNDRRGYIEFSIANLKTAKGLPPIPPVAGRWYNLGTIIMQTENDLWLHRQGNHLWWTVTKSQPGEVFREPDPSARPGEPPMGMFYRKPAAPWSKASVSGNPLDWRTLHPKVADFLMTEATLQELSSIYAEYALALVNGDSLSTWHNDPIWKKKLEGARSQRPGSVFNARQLTFSEMAIRARDITSQANGQQVLRTMKRKEFRFVSVQELERYIAELYEMQEGLCALTGLPLQFKGGDDPQLCCSLDRINSDAHYERDNLQVVCRFVNGWKSDMEDIEFRRLLDLVRT